MAAWLRSLFPTVDAQRPRASQDGLGGRHHKAREERGLQARCVIPPQAGTQCGHGLCDGFHRRDPRAGGDPVMSRRHSVKTGSPPARG